ncbi:hypothetical protein BH11ACT8_BH11ACT8_35920 [soil metagenome]
MSTSVIVYLLTALAAVVVVLTRLRLRRSRRSAGRVQVARGPVGVHTAFGVLALCSWLTCMGGGDSRDEDTLSLLGLAALVCWWVVALAGLLILARWLPARGRHASGAVDDSWSEGPGLSVLGHVGMVVGVIVFTYAYLVKAV